MDGTGLVSFYNNAYAPALGIKPDALGQPFPQVWPEVWNELAPVVAGALAGEASSFEDLHLTLERKGYPEETWWTSSYSPIRTGSGAEQPNGGGAEQPNDGVGGVLCIVHETTERVLTERRLRFLVDLGNRLRGLSDPRDVVAVAAEALGRYLGADAPGTARLMRPARYSRLSATGPSEACRTSPAGTASTITARRS